MQSLRAILPLLTYGLLIIGNGSMLTLTSMELARAEENVIAIGLVNAAFFFGMWMAHAVGGKLFEKMDSKSIESAGFALVVISILLQSLFFTPMIWLPLRFLNGFASAMVLRLLDESLAQNSERYFSPLQLSFFLASIPFCQALSLMLVAVPSDDLRTTYTLLILATQLGLLPLACTKDSLNKFDFVQSNIIAKVRAPFFARMASALSGWILAGIFCGLPVVAWQRHPDNFAFLWWMITGLILTSLTIFVLPRITEILKPKMLLLGLCLGTALVGCLAAVLPLKSFLLSLFTVFTLILAPTLLSVVNQVITLNKARREAQSMINDLQRTAFVFSAFSGFITPIAIYHVGPSSFFYLLAIPLGVFGVGLALDVKSKLFA